jgi:hypothetical protein
MNGGLNLHLLKLRTAGSSCRSMKSGTTVADSDIKTEPCLAESCASFEFVSGVDDVRLENFNLEQRTSSE